MRVMRSYLLWKGLDMYELWASPFENGNTFALENKKTQAKGASHKDIGFLLVGVDVLGDPHPHCRDRRSTAVRSRSGSGSHLGFHSLPSRRFATSTVRKDKDLIRRKQRDNPDRFSKSLSGFVYSVR